MIHQRKRALLEGPSGVFERGVRKVLEVDQEQVKDKYVCQDRQVKRKMIELKLPSLSVGKQYTLHSISRSSFYYEPRSESEMNIDLIRLIDKKFLETRFYGMHRMTWHLRSDDHLV